MTESTDADEHRSAGGPGSAERGAAGETAQADLDTHLASLTRDLSLADMAGFVAHEISQPLGVMLMHASACLRWLNQDPPAVAEARKAAEAVVRDGNRARQVLQEVREIAPDRAPELRSLDLNRELQDAIQLVKPRLEAASIELRWAPGSLPRIPFDRLQVTLVMVNLVVNAIEAMAASPVRTLTIATSYDPDEGALVRVCDSGAGVDPQFANRIFAPLFTTKSGATGLGLSIARRIVEAHGGRLWATFNEEGGATFSFTIPGAEHA